jgi:protein-tyrosine phosphatase
MYICIKSSYFDNMLLYSADLFKMHELYKGLFISGIYPATSRELLSTNSIDIILRVNDIQIQDYVRDMYNELGIQYYHIPMQDEDSYHISVHFNTTNKLIFDALKNGKKILVHCTAGISRSATIIIAFLLMLSAKNNKDFTVDEAIRILRTHRQIIKPNNGFIQQLNLYNNYLYKCKILAHLDTSLNRT